MRIEILVLAALAALASAAPQWPYRDAVAPYYYGYPGKTPYMYRSGDEDDEMDESYLARQDLKVAAPKDAAAAGSSVTVIEDDEKADGIRVVETGSAKPVAQSGNNNIRQQTQQQEQAAAPAASTQPQAQQPLSNNNPNNAQPANNGQPLTVQQPGQQPPAFPPARPTGRPRPPPVEEEEDEDEEEDDSEEDEEDAEDEEDGDDDDEDEEDEEDEEDRRRNDKVVQPGSGSGSESEEPQQLPIVQEQQQSPQFSIVNNNSEGSDELVQEEEQPVVVQPQSQSAVLNNKVSKNKQKNVAPVVVPNAGGNRKKVSPAAVAIGSNKNKNNPGAIEALVPGYVTDQGEVLVPVDTVTGSQPITIVPDPFSPPSRIVSGPRPIPQSAVPSNPGRQVPYWYRSSPAASPFNQEPAPRQTLYSSVPPPGSIFTFDDDDDDDEDTPSVIPGNRLRQEDDDDDGQDEESEENEVKVQPKPQKVPLAAIPASGNSGEDDEAEALAFVNSGRPISANKRPVANAASGSGSKKPSAGGTQGPSSNESESEEDIESEEDEVSQEEEEEEEDDAARRVVLQTSNKGRMYVDEDYVSFPPSRSPTLFAVIQGGFPGQRQQSQVISSPSPYNSNQRYVVRVTPANRPRPQPQQPLYYRPVQSSPPNRRVVPVASFDVSVEDTGPQSGPSAYYPGVDSDEEGESVISSSGRPTPVSSYPFVYKVQGALQGLRLPGQGGPRPSGSRPSRPSRPPGAYAYFGGPGGPGGPSRPPRPSYSPYSSPYASLAAALYGPYGPNGPSFSGPNGPSFSGPSGFSFSGPNGPRRPGGPPVIVRRKQPGGGPNRPPKPQLIAVYNPTGSSSSGPGPQRPRPREPVDEEYYTFEVPETNHKLIPGRPPTNNKRPTVHRKPTPVIHQKLVNEDEEESDEIAPGGPPSPQHTIQIIPQGTVRRRVAKQLKSKKKSSKKNSSSTKKQPQQDQQDPLGLLSKINKSTKSKFH